MELVKRAQSNPAQNLARLEWHAAAPILAERGTFGSRGLRIEPTHTISSWQYKPYSLG
jgi:hypothetical protein